MSSVQIIVNAEGPQTRVAVVEGGNLVELHVERRQERGLVGNIYKGRVVRVLPGMQAAFVDVGLERTAFLYVGDVQTAPASDLLDLLDDYDGLEGQSGPARIEDLISEREEVLVQVAKEPLGNKGARLTTHITLPGRLLVYMPTFRHVGVSRRITDDKERRRLRELVETLRKDENKGFIIRTAAEGASAGKLASDMDFLTRLWRQIQDRFQKVCAPALLHEDLDLALRSVRDLLASDADRCVVDSISEYDRIKEFVSTFMPRFTNNVELYDGPEPIFDAFGLEAQVDRALERQVWLKSGGYLVIDQTEALTAIDVNTGRFVGKRNLEETITQTNLEACREIAAQIRLRNLGGIIVIDFIDMEKESSRRKVWRALEEALAKDRVRVHLGQFSSLGLVEMTRKRTRGSLVRALTEPCPYCEGKGYLKSSDTVACEVLRAIRRETAFAGRGDVVVVCHPDVAEILAQAYSEALEALEHALGRPVLVQQDASLHREDFRVYVR